MEHVHDRKACIQPDEIRKFQRPHGMVGTKLQALVDGLHVADALIQRIDRLVDHRHQDTVHDEGREIFGAGCGLAKLAHHFQHRLIGRLVRCDAADQLDQLHDWHRVHEVETHELLRPVGARGQPRDRDRRCVRGQDSGGFQMRQQILEDRLLDRFPFRCRLDHQIGLPHICQLQRGLDPGHCGVLHIGRDLAARHLPIEVLGNKRHRLVQRLLRDVRHQNVKPCHRKDMGDTVAHLTGADNSDRLDIHLQTFHCCPRRPYDPGLCRCKPVAATFASLMNCAGVFLKDHGTELCGSCFLALGGKRKGPPMAGLPVVFRLRKAQSLPISSGTAVKRSATRP